MGNTASFPEHGSSDTGRAKFARAATAEVTQIRRLNTMRGSAAIIVLIAHFSNSSGLWGKLLGQGAGHIGVMLFFLLSGFLMSHLYWQQEPTARNMMRFAVSRTAKIMPLYIAVVTVSYATPYLYPIDDGRHFIAHLLFLYGEGILWTIPPEVQAYVIFAFIWFISWHDKRMFPGIMFAILIGTYLLQYKSTLIDNLWLPIHVTLIKTISYFCVGCLLGIAYNYRALLSAYQSNMYLAAILVIPLLYPNIHYAIYDFNHDIWKDSGVLLTTTITFFSLVFLVPDSNRILENGIGDFFGRISYSLYLLHIPVLSLMMDLGLTGNGISSLLLFIILSTIAAWISYQLLEEPARMAIRSWHSTRDQYAKNTQSERISSCVRRS